MNQCKVLSNEELQNILRNETKYIDKGYYSQVFHFNDSQVIKIWKNNFSIAILNEFRRNIQELLTFNNPSLLTPQQVVLVDGKIVGYLMPYFAGDKINNLAEETVITSLIDALEKFEKEIPLIAKEKLWIDDIHGKNIMYGFQNGNRLVLEDCDTWFFPKHISYKECFENIVREFNRNFLNEFVMDAQNDLKWYLKKDPKLRNMIIKFNCLFSISEFLGLLKNNLEIIAEEQVMTLSDMKRVLKNI